MNEKDSKTPKFTLQPIQKVSMIIEILLLIVTIVVIIQNSRTITIDFLWMQIDILLPILVLLTGSLGSLFTLINLFFKK